MGPIDELARLYFSEFPVERGKWRVWDLLRPALRPKNAEKTLLVGKYRIRMKLRTTNYIDHFIYYWNCWEPNETWVIGQILKPGDVFIDVGANIGYFTLVASHIVGARGKVIAFEPVPPIVSRLKENTALNNQENIEIRESAVADHEGTVRIGKPSGSDFLGSSIRNKDQNDQCWEVSCVSLDQVVERDQTIKLLKLDAEGAEFLVLKGFIKHLEAGLVHHVLCEITDTFLKQLGSSSNELYAFMTGVGYEAFSCERSRLTPITSQSVAQKYQSNILFSQKRFQLTSSEHGSRS
jgi:FkbM family methyltransferase